MLTTDLINQARERIMPRIHRTPVVTSRQFNEVAGKEVYFKCENLQRAGAFKIRGATNKIQSLSAAEKQQGIVAFSSGNHAQAVALAGREAGVRVLVAMPEDAPAAKVAATRGWNDADIVVNVQGDEPLIPPRVIDQVAELLAANPKADIATLAVKIESQNDLADPNNVKVACDGGGRALYFSRAPIPFNRDTPTTLSAACLRHVGIYAYRVSALRKLSGLPA